MNGVDVPELTRRMPTLLGLPLWVFALVVAALAPFGARAWGTAVERRVRARSVRRLANLGRVNTRALGASSVGRAGAQTDAEAKS